MQRVVDQPAGHLPRAAAKTQTAHPSFSMNIIVIEETFDAWRQQVSTENQLLPTLRPITSEEMTEVSLATVRESSTHRRWPKEIVEKFMAAEVSVSPSSYTSPGKLAIITRWPLYYLAKS